MLASYFGCGEILSIDFNLLLELCIRNICFDRSVSKRLHEFVTQKLSVLGFIGMTDDHFINVRLRNFFGDLVFLSRAQGHTRTLH